MIGIDLFSGAGGMSLGARKAGVKVVLAVEADVHAAATYRTNFSDVKLLNQDIASVTADDLPPRTDEPTVLFGGPPCQGFSTSNQRTRNSLNPRNWLFREFLRIARLWQPDWIVFENVKGITETEHGVFLDEILDDINCLGYRPVAATLNAVDFGVPQKRTRLFVVASRQQIPFTMPDRITATPLTVAEAFCNLPKLQNGACENILPYQAGNTSTYAQQMRVDLQSCSGHLVTRNASHVLDRYRHIPEGGNWENIPETLMTNYADRSRCHTGIYHRLQWNAPSIVIGNYRKNMLIHPTQDRGLSVREAARLQGIPDDFKFSGSIGFQQQQVGNMVPPPLANAVFSSLLIF